MSMQPRSWPPVPQETARVAREAFPKGSLAMRLRDELGIWCSDEDFAGLYADQGKPGISPAQLAVVSALQFACDLTDRQAAEAVAGRIDWKYALGLELTDPGWHYSVLCEYRDRFAGAGLEKLPLDLLLDRCRELGLVVPGMRQRTDSTHVLARIRELNRLELAGESVRAALEELARAEPQWLATVIDDSRQRAYGQRISELRLPAGKDARAKLAVQYGRDGYFLLRQVTGPAAPAGAAGLRAVRALRMIWVQQFSLGSGPDGEKVTWREDSGDTGLPPGRTRIVSPYDTDARYGEKRGEHWTGFKNHLSETVSDPARDDPGTGRPGHPNLVTNTETTRASVADAAMTQVIHDHLALAGLPPGEHLADSGYASGELITRARGAGITLVTPLLTDNSPQARTGGYTAGMFGIDWDNRQVTCPEGKTSTSWRPGRQDGTGGIIVTQFPVAACRPCPVRDKCTTATKTGRQLKLRTREIHEAIAAARAEQDTARWKKTCNARAGVEGLMHQASHVTGIRHARYLGLAKTTLEHNLAAVAINLIRLDNWWTATPPDRRRIRHLQRLNLTPAT